MVEIIPYFRKYFKFEDIIMKELTGHVRAAIDHYNMISPGDKIAVCVSGGKDSLFLLESLAKLRHYYPGGFSITAITIDPQFNDVACDFGRIESFCSDLGIEYHLRRTHLGDVVFGDKATSNPCSVCARMRRGMLHNMALELGCNKIALGHHMDDAIETFVMNLIYSGNIACFSPVTYLTRKNLYVIRPLIFCEERDILNYSRRNSLPVVKSSCPVNGATSRATTDNLIEDFAKTHPDIKAKIFGAMQRSHLNGF
jgi:tRNA 2-thiocytidine biosynthesis protein TtcA